MGTGTRSQNWISATAMTIPGRPERHERDVVEELPAGQPRPEVPHAIRLPSRTVRVAAAAARPRLFDDRPPRDVVLERMKR